jgi:hypothetical protein
MRRINFCESKISVKVRREASELRHGEQEKHNRHYCIHALEYHDGHGEELHQAVIGIESKLE